MEAVIEVYGKFDTKLKLKTETHLLESFLSI